MSLEPGQIFAGKYRVERLLGAGGMGEVFAATHLELGELVALKVMIDDTATTDALARFQREARAAARLKSEFIARVLEVGRDDGLPFIVLEHIEGKDLQEVAGTRSPLPMAEATAFIAQACEGVAEAHALGMVHRDLKLRNLFLTQRADGRPLVKILDFGVVKLTNPRADEQSDQPSLTLTQADTLIGSLPYMAPEQIQMSSKVDARADVWSLGVCLYELLAGARPFQGETVADTIMAITRRPPPDLRDARPEIPRDLADAVERALEKSLHRRYPSVADLARALAPHAGDPTLGDRVQAVLARGAKPAGAPTTRDSTPEIDRALAATRNWGPGNREAVEQLTKAPPPRIGVPAASTPEVHDATTRPLPRASLASSPSPDPSSPLEAPVAPAAAVAPLVTPRDIRSSDEGQAHSPSPPVAAIVVGALLALVVLVGWLAVRGRAHPVAASNAPSATAPPAEITPAASMRSSPSAPTSGATQTPAAATSSPAIGSQLHGKPAGSARPRSHGVPSGSSRTPAGDPYDTF